MSITDGFCDDCGAYIGDGPDSRDSCPNCGAELDDSDDDEQRRFRRQRDVVLIGEHHGLRIDTCRRAHHRPFRYRFRAR